MKQALLCCLLTLCACESAVGQADSQSDWERSSYPAYGIRIVVPDGVEETDLYLAVRDGDSERVRALLLYNGADLDARYVNENTLLHLAAMNGDTEIVEALLAVGLDPNARNAYGSTPLHSAVIFARMPSYFPVNLVGFGFDENDREESIKDLMIELLVDSGADPNVRDAYGISPLYLATRFADTEIVMVLLEVGANPNIRDSFGNSPLHWAVNFSTTETVRVLIQAGALPNVRNNQGITPLHVAAFGGGVELDGGSPWSQPSRSSQVGIVRALIEADADLEAQDFLVNTPLHWAAESGNVEAVRALLEAGANPDTRNNDDNTALYVAAIPPWNLNFATVWTLIVEDFPSWFREVPTWILVLLSPWLLILLLLVLLPWLLVTLLVLGFAVNLLLDVGTLGRGKHTSLSR